jgi:hypothetical protein
LLFSLRVAHTPGLAHVAIEDAGSVPARSLASAASIIVEERRRYSSYQEWRTAERGRVAE